MVYRHCRSTYYSKLFISLKTASRKYDVYGAVRSSTGTSTSKHKFVGSLGHPSEDETGLNYMRARYYNPQTGRFESQDPSKQGNNYFAYCENNPVKNVDPTGRITVEEWLAWQAAWQDIELGRECDKRNPNGSWLRSDICGWLTSN